MFPDVSTPRILSSSLFDTGVDWRERVKDDGFSLSPSKGVVLKVQTEDEEQDPTPVNKVPFFRVEH